MSSSAVLGKFLWHELLTPDPAAGGGFYSAVFDWQAAAAEGHPGYVMLATAKGPVGGARIIGKDELADKVGANWLTYVGVPDVKAALAQVEMHGGQVIHPVTEVPDDGGRYAVIADPQGAVIGLFDPGSRGGMAPAGPVEWHELTAEDPLAALRFYEAIFGWEVVATHEMGGEVGTYYLFGTGSTQLGGVFKRAAHLPPTWPRWLVYLGVPGVEAAVAAAKRSGGTVLNGPMQVPGGNWVAQLIDSHGVAVAIHGAKEAAAAPVVAKPKAAASKRSPQAAPAAVESKPKAKAKAKTKSKTKSSLKKKSAPKSKIAAPRKAKAKPKPKAKAKTKVKAKAAPKARPPMKSKAKKAQQKPKATTKGKPKSVARARAKPRRGK